MMPEIAKMLVLTTAHVSEKTAKFLDDCAIGDHRWAADIPIVVYNKDEYGWFIPLIAALPWHPDLPAELHAIRAKAEELGCTWIMFDRDADLIDDLEEFDW